MTSDSTPAFEIEKEALKTEIETGIQAGVDHLEAKTAKRKDADKYHNTRHQYNPQQKLFSLVRSAEVSSVTLRNLTARTVRDDTAPFYCEVADLLGIKVEETHDWLKISVPAILPKRNQRDNQAFLTRPLRYAIMDYLKENPMERFGSCAICIVHNYDAALGKRRIRDYDNIETKRYLDVIESMLLTNDSGLLCTVLQATRMSDRDSAEFYLMRPETLSSWAKNHIKTTTKTCSE